MSNFVFIPPKRNMQIEEDDFEEVYLETKNKNKIQTIFIPNKNAIFTILVSHGNAEDVHGTYKWAKKFLLNFVNANVFLYGMLS